MGESNPVSFGVFGHQLLPGDNGQLVIRVDKAKNATIGRTKQSVGGGDTKENPLPQEIFAELRRKGFLKEEVVGVAENRESVLVLNEAGKTYFRKHDRYGNSVQIRMNNGGHMNKRKRT